MSRYKPDRAKLTKERILRIASGQIRQNGVEGIRIKELMKAAGMTNGGFYLHFESREDMIVEALKAASAKLELLDPADITLKDALEIYLSIEHRDVPAEGCVLAAVVNEAGRSAEIIRNAFTERARSRLLFFKR